jgi:hypothetical protein
MLACDRVIGPGMRISVTDAILVNDMAVKKPFFNGVLVTLESFEYEYLVRISRHVAGCVEVPNW